MKRRVEELNVAAIANSHWSNDLAAWVGGLGDALYGKLSGVGLLPVRERSPATTLACFLGAHIAGRTDVKQSTRDHFGRVRNHLVEYFGEARPLSSISAGDADDFRRWLTAEKGKRGDGKGLAENTSRRECSRAKQFFRAAVRKKLIAENPFADQKGLSVQSNKAREFFVDRATTEKIINACPSADWRSIVALCRYGGLRCPSEVLLLKWSDFNWAERKISVTSPKTAHHEGKGERIIPLFRELSDVLDEAYEAAPEGAVFVVHSCAGDNKRNLRTQFERILRSADVEKWEKPFQNMRASRATELVANHPGHVAAAWLGHSEQVARGHYWQGRDSDFEAALEPAADEGDAKALHKVTQQVIASARTGHRGEKEKTRIAPECSNVHPGATLKAPPVGLELEQLYSDSEGPVVCAAKISALCQESGSVDPGLAEVVATWPTLPDAVRRSLLAMIRAESDNGQS